MWPVEYAQVEVCVCMPKNIMEKIHSKFILNLKLFKKNWLHWNGGNRNGGVWISKLNLVAFLLFKLLQ